MKYAVLLSFFLLSAGVSPEVNLSVSTCTERLASGYLFLKSHSIKPSSDGFYETSYVFTKGSTYSLVVCCPSTPQRFELYNSQRNKLISTTDPLVFSNSIQYNCQATGIYYYRVYAQEGEIVLGFKR